MCPRRFGYTDNVIRQARADMLERNRHEEKKSPAYRPRVLHLVPRGTMKRAHHRP